VRVLKRRGAELPQPVIVDVAARTAHEVDCAARSIAAKPRKLAAATH